MSEGKTSRATDFSRWPWLMHQKAMVMDLLFSQEPRDYHENCVRPSIRPSIHPSDHPQSQYRSRTHCSRMTMCA